MYILNQDHEFSDDAPHHGKLSAVTDIIVADVFFRHSQLPYRNLFAHDRPDSFMIDDITQRDDQNRGSIDLFRLLDNEQGTPASASLSAP